MTSHQAVRDVYLAHGYDNERAEQEIRALLEDCVADGVYRQEGDHVDVGRSGYCLTVDPTLGTVSGYRAPAGEWAYTDYLDLGPYRERPERPLTHEPAIESALELDDFKELVDYVDPGDLYISKNAFARAAEYLELDHLNSWDVDRAIRTELRADLRDAVRISRLDSGRFVVLGKRVVWVVREDGYALTGLRRLDDWDWGRAGVSAASSPVADIVTSDAEPREATELLEPVSPPGSSPQQRDLVAQIERLVSLRQAGFLTETEFKAAKSLLLREP